MIADSGKRREFDTGAVRDIDTSKGRCDLLPLDVVARLMESTGTGDCEIIYDICGFVDTRNVSFLYDALAHASELFADGSVADMLLEVSVHFAEGAKKYAEDNWKKGIPEKSYVDSAIRHYLKHIRGDIDERHDRALVWNLMCLIWTVKHINKADKN